MEKEIKFREGVKKIGLERTQIAICQDQRLGEISMFETTQRIRYLSSPEISTVVSLQRYVASSGAFRGEKRVDSKMPHHTTNITC